MQSVIETLKAWQPHPFVDHFTVALILLGIITDLVASLFSARLWLRYMALTLIILGAFGAWGSNVTGGWEAGRVWDSVTGPGKDVLQRHAWWGGVLPWVFSVLALWRIGVQFIGVIAELRPIYLLVAILTGVAIFYQAHLGGEMVYDYGVGTALLLPAATASPSAAQPSPQATFSPAPAIMPTAAPSPTVSASVLATPAPTVGTAPAPMNSPSASPAATPSAGNSETPVNPPSGESATPGSSEPKNL
jgi:uncharacterized membrane protein